MKCAITAVLNMAFVFQALMVSANRVHAHEGKVTQHERPNVILILADDLAIGDLGGGDGHPTRTPNLDRLAEQSVRFLQAYSGSCVCAPARAALLTGRYPHRTGVVTLNQNKYPQMTRLRRDESTMADMLRTAGYATGLIGKWHTGRGEGYHPLDRGFDEFEGFDGSSSVGYFKYPLDVQGTTKTVTDRYLTDDLTGRAISFVQRHREHPFFLHLAHYAPHRPLEAAPAAVRRYQDQGFDESTATIYAMIEVMDRGIGDLLQELDKLKLVEQTIVIFASDNGPDPLTGRRFNQNLRGNKYQVHEGGIRVPLFVRWPGRFSPGERKQPVHFVDLLPTVLELTNTSPPLINSIDGQSFAPVLRHSAAEFSQVRYWQWNRGRPNYTHNAAMLDGQYKLVRPYVTRASRLTDSLLPAELYDLKDDSTESVDVAVEHPEVVSRMNAQLQAWAESVEQDRLRVEQDGTPRQPNIVFILADDLGYGDVSCYNSESKINTPHVDRLASEGMRFTDAHTPSAVCTPTRYGILTGRYAWRTRLKYRVLDGLDPPLIEAGRLTVPSLLKQHGYDTACIGKWHLGMQWTDKSGQQVPAVRVDRKSRPRTGADVDYTVPVTGGPTAVGFNSYFGISASLNMSPFCYLRDNRPVRLPALHQPRISTEFISVDEGVRSPDFTITGVMPRLSGEAVGYIERQTKKDRDQPFFLYAPLTSPHLPLVPNEEFHGTSGAGHYGDFVVETDAFVGVILETLDRLEIADDTMVVFTSDNGGLYHYWEPKESDDLEHYKVRTRGAYVKQFEHQGNAHLRGTKADIWEGGHRVPLVVRWPGKTPAGGVSKELVELTDLLATCAALVDAKLSDEMGPDSFNALPALLTEKPNMRVREFAVHHSLWGTFAIRSGPWKMIPSRGSGGFTFPKTIDTARVGGPAGQLYNLDDDPSETKNLWDKHPRIAAGLTELLATVQKGD